MKKPKRSRISAAADCDTFDIEVTAHIGSKSLNAQETDEVKRKFKQDITNVISKLPFSHIYPFEVTVR